MRQAVATTARILSQRMSRTIKAKRYNTLAACIRRSIWNDIGCPLAVDRRCAGTPARGPTFARRANLVATRPMNGAPHQPTPKIQAYLQPLHSEIGRASGRERVCQYV